MLSLIELYSLTYSISCCDESERVQKPWSALTEHVLMNILFQQKSALKIALYQMRIFLCLVEEQNQMLIFDLSIS